LEFYQVAYYGLGLNSAVILETIGFGNAKSKGIRAVYDILVNICIGNLILAIAGLIPGYWVTFLFVDHWGRKPIQFMGFTMLTIIFIIMGTLISLDGILFEHSCIHNLQASLLTNSPPPPPPKSHLYSYTAWATSSSTLVPTQPHSSSQEKFSPLVIVQLDTVSPPEAANWVLSSPRSDSVNSRISVERANSSSTSYRSSPCSCLLVSSRLSFFQKQMERRLRNCHSKNRRASSRALRIEQRQRTSLLNAALFSFDTVHICCNVSL
jgi:hypothetical protein